MVPVGFIPYRTSLYYVSSCLKRLKKQTAKVIAVMPIWTTMMAKFIDTFSCSELSAGKAGTSRKASSTETDNLVQAKVVGSRNVFC